MATRNQTDVGLSGASGTGSFAGTTSPTLTTPSINQINDANGNSSISLGATASAVNYLYVGNSASGLSLELQAIGSDANIGLNIRTKGAGLTQLVSEAPNTPLIIYNGTSSQHATNFSFSNTAATRTVTMPDADGTLAFTSDIPPFSNMEVFTASGTFTPSATTSKVYVKVWGAGGGGGGGGAAAGAGGGAGGYSEGMVTVTPSSGVTVTVGAFGTGSLTTVNGVAGGASSFAGGTTPAGAGGSGGIYGGTGPTAGGAGSGGTLNVTGGSGGATNTTFGGNGGGAFGGNGGAFAVEAQTGQSAVGHGGGGAGGGGPGGYSGGNGAPGLVVVYY